MPKAQKDEKLTQDHMMAAQGEVARTVNELVGMTTKAFVESRQAWTAHHDAQDEIARLKTIIEVCDAALASRDEEIVRLTKLVQGTPPTPPPEPTPAKRAVRSVK